MKVIHRHDLLAALLLFILPLLLFWSVTIGPNTLLPIDNLFAFEPWRSYRETHGIGEPQNQLVSDLILENYVWKKFVRESISARQLPLWNPYILSGQPFLANGQHSAMYPFSLIFYVLPLTKAYGWFTVSQLWLAGLFMYIFCRTLRISRLGALVAGIAYSLSAFFIVRVVFTMVLAGAVWLPLILAMIETVVRKQEEKGQTSYSPVPYIVAGAIALGLQTLAGHVEITYYTLIVSGFYALCRLIVLWRRQQTFRYVFRLGLWLLFMACFGVALGAAQLVPMYEIVTQNFRDNSVTLDQVRGWALPIRRVATFLIPDFFGSPAHHGYFDVVTWQWQKLGLNANGEINPLCPNCTSWDTKTAVEGGAYLGILPLALAGLAILQSIRHRLQSTFSTTTIIFTLLAIVSLLFAFGTPLYAILYYGLPGWNQLHSPFRWLFPYTLSMAILAGVGVAYLERWVSTQWREMEKSPPPNLPLTGGGVNASPHLGGIEEGQPRPTPSFLATISLYLGWLLFWIGILGLIGMLTALFLPTPFIQAASFVFDRSGLAQNAFANGRQFFGYQWPNLFRFFLMLTASGAILRIVRCPIDIRNLIPGLNRLLANPVSAWMPLIVIVVAIDLLMAGAGFNPSVNPELLQIKPRVVQWLEDQAERDPYFRINSFDTPDGPGNKVYLANATMFSNLFDVRGYDSIIPGQYAQFMQLIQPNGDLLFNRIGPLYYDGYNALDSALLDLLGVRYILTAVEIGNPNYELVYNDEVRVYENLDVMPRAFVVHEQMDIGDDLGFALRSLNPREKIILDGENNGLGESRPEAPSIQGHQLSAETTITEYTPNQVKVATTLAEPGWLVLADSYFVGWRAYVTAVEETETSAEIEGSQEVEVTLHRANGNFRAIELPAGQWEVRFRYSPRSFQLGLYGSFLAFVTLIFALGAWAWGKLYREHEDDSAIKRVAKNSLVPMVMAISNRLIDFAFALLMLRILQPEGAGRYAFAVAFIGLTEILTRYGLGTLVTRDVAADRGQTNRYLSNVTILRLYLWLLALPIMVAILGVYLIYGNLTTDVLITIAIFAVGALLSNFSDGLTAIFYAHEKAEYPAAIASVTALSRVSVGALVLLLGWGIIGLAAASLFANLVAFVVLAYILITKIYRPSYEADRGLQREMVSESFPLMINHLLATIFFRIDVFILQPQWGDESVGFYNAAYKYVDGINVIPQYFTLAIFPLMSRFAADSRDSLARAYILSLRLLLIMAFPIAMGTPFVARELIFFLAGERFLPASMIVLQLLIWFLPFSFINQVTQYVLIAINQQRHLTRAFIIGVLFNLMTNLIFIPFYGYRAAAITTILSEWSLLIPFYLLVRKHLCTVPWLDVVWRPIVATAAMGLSLWLIGDTNFLATISIGTAVYFVTLIIVGGFNQPDMNVIWRAIPLKRLRERFAS